MNLFKLFGQAKNFTSDIVSAKVKAERISICESCPKYRKDFKTWLVKKKGVPQCGKCKCAIHEKTMWSGERCPLNKW